jgi:hypothetical protein
MWGHPQHVEHSDHEWANPHILGRFPHDQVPRTPAVRVFPSPGSRISLPKEGVTVSTMEENDQQKAAARLARRAAETDDAKEREEIRSRVAMLVGREEQRRLWRRYLNEGGV